MLHELVLKLFKELDRPDANGEKIEHLFKSYGHKEITVTEIREDDGGTDFLKIKIPGTNGKTAGGDAPTLGIIGRLGGIGARPEQTGFVSDGDGALAALTSALKIVDMKNNGESLEGDVIIATHVDPNAPTIPHDPVPFMGSSVDMTVMNKHEIDDEMDAIITIDATKGNRITNFRGICISPTVKEGYILRVSETMIDILQNVTGKPASVLPITMQDITPYGNDVYHINSILQPCTATDKPVVGLAITSGVAVPGSGSGASQLNDVEEAARFSVEVAKQFGKQKAFFHDAEEYAKLRSLYGSMAHLQTLGKK
ncbi:DUF1177 domain-containing protein [Salinicoccus sp. ID82-1]|uniref:DUF1177 domain-containing protein n=1 Tax=Salinicoccus sp. ID82-1 TaxID=2820269 RepID=UPI001F18FB5E|nr:DUF1177 domain-containing protein [Salinicoccus sp. ID82-1]MCG1009702.1 DUF1177 domain-containing protein [Salinicoccus sp. ID82-1]